MTNITLPRATVEQALEALKYLHEEKCNYMRRNNLGDPLRENAARLALPAITTLRAALAQQAEPVQDQRCRAEPRSDGDFVCDCKIGECLGRSAALAKQVKTCAWRDNLDAIYETECGNLHIVNDGTLEENGMKYCCYCGKEIEDESPK